MLFKLSFISEFKFHTYPVVRLVVLEKMAEIFMHTLCEQQIAEPLAKNSKNSTPGISTAIWRID